MAPALPRGPRERLQARAPGRRRAASEFGDLRRSCGTLLIRQDVPLHVVSRILGHSSTAVAESVCAHLANQQIRSGLGALADSHRDLQRSGRHKAA